MVLNDIFKCASALYEYGFHVNGEIESYNLTGRIPLYQPTYHLNLTHGKEGVKNNYTYISVEYEHESPLHIVYDPKKLSLSFYVRIPVKEIPFKIIGYSMPLK
ncbi:uncharacterized protein [Choristoneura fumiferana]|uniref:uncharacterized protein n=1 Tax=Choristoneura fumiferana TaxID=7141 RepID=UPI003D15E701